MTEKKQQHKKKRGKVQHIRGSPKKRKISGKAVFSSESIPGKMLADVKNLITVHFTGLSGRHSVLERPLYEVNGRPFFSQKTTA